MTIGDLVSTIVLTGFGGNYLFFLFVLIIIIAALMFFLRWTGAEAILVGVLFSYGLMAANINPLFTALFAAVMLGVGIMIIVALYRQFANG